MPRKCLKPRSKVGALVAEDLQPDSWEMVWAVLLNLHPPSIWSTMSQTLSYMFRPTLRHKQISLFFFSLLNMKRCKDKQTHMYPIVARNAFIPRTMWCWGEQGRKVFLERLSLCVGTWTQHLLNLAPDDGCFLADVHTNDWLSNDGQFPVLQHFLGIEFQPWTAVVIPPIFIVSYSCKCRTVTSKSIKGRFYDPRKLNSVLQLLKNWIKNLKIVFLLRACLRTNILSSV